MGDKSEHISFFGTKVTSVDISDVTVVGWQLGGCIVPLRVGASDVARDLPRSSLGGQVTRLYLRFSRENLPRSREVVRPPNTFGQFW